MNATEPVKHSMDILSIGTIVGTLAGLLPPIAALLSIIWLSLQIIDHIKKKRAKAAGKRRRATDF